VIAMIALHRHSAIIDSIRGAVHFRGELLIIVWIPTLNQSFPKTHTTPYHAATRS